MHHEEAKDLFRHYEGNFHLIQEIPNRIKEEKLNFNEEIAASDRLNKNSQGWN